MYQSIHSKIAVAFAAILTFVLFLSSCKKDDDNDGMASVQVVHSSETTGPVDLYIDNARVNSQAVAYTQSSGYFQIPAGSKTAEIRLAGSAQVVNTVNLDLEEGKNYTIYVSGSSSTEGSVVTNDNTSTPSDGQAKVRFVNLSSLVSSASVLLDNSSAISSNLLFGATSDFSTVAAGTHTFKAYSSANANVNVTTSLNLQAGKVYTVYLTGTSSLSLNAVVNN